MQPASTYNREVLGAPFRDIRQDATDDVATTSSLTMHKAEAAPAGDTEPMDYCAGGNDVLRTMPGKTLRRRPGGHLKTTNHVHDLEPPGHNKSIDSLSIDTDSPGGSLLIMGNHESDASDADTTHPKKVSMINTHSSQHLRPSFEAAISGFSAIPDDDDGGLEATLAKLEGSYEKLSPMLVSTIVSGETNPTYVALNSADGCPQSPSKRQNRSHHVQEDAQLQFDQILAPDHSRPATLRACQSANVKSLSSSHGLYHHSVTVPRDSGDMLPLIERGLNTEYVTDHAQSPPTNRLITSHPEPSNEAADSPNSTSSIGILEKTASIEQAVRPSTAEPSSAQSFLLDEDENLSDLSSEISVDIINQSDVIQRPFSPMIAAPGTARSGLDLPTHPLGHPSGLSEPVKSAITQYNANVAAGLPPTPDASPVQAFVEQRGGREEFSWEPVAQTQLPASMSTVSVHIPFILACDSQVLAQQFTLVEKEALNEVEWNDLVEMSWDNKAADVHDWAEYLSTTSHTGIDLVVTRFNIVVKWVLSEIVLTQDIKERACVIAKYIHMAAHARRLHNYATMLQITIALTSTDCTRLVKTWALVPAPDRSVLKNMESLVQPVRNFHDLRSEMESANLTDGCIPFIGLSSFLSTVFTLICPRPLHS